MMKRLLNISLAIILALGLNFVMLPNRLVVAQTTVYVDASNIAGPWDGTFANPYQNIQDGINAAASGDTVQVNAGIYYENITLESGVIVQGQGAAFTTIDGGGNGWVVTANNIGAVAKLDGFTITNGKAIGGTFGGGGISINVWIGVSSPTISNNTVINNDGLGIYTTYFSESIITDNFITGNLQGIRTDNSWPIITNNIITDNSEYGIYNEYAAPTITNNIISGNGVHGIHNNTCNEGQWGSPIITNNTITSNSGSGIRGYQSELIISNNIITSNFEYGISEFPAYASIDYNNVWGNLLGEYQDTLAGPNDISLDPIFVDTTSRDYRLQSGSPAIDAGDNTAVPVWLTTDFEGDLRIMGTAVDMGADEYAGSTNNLLLQVEEMFEEGLIDNHGVLDSLISQINAAINKIENGQTKPAENILYAFINSVQAQAGKHISLEAAEILITDAEYIISQLAQ
jgi:parallel beta-helix repeat protein